MPALAQAVFTIGNVVPLAVIGFIALRYARHNATPIPLFMVPVYIWYVGGQAFIVFRSLARGITCTQFVCYWIVLMLVYGAPGLLMGVCTYHDALMPMTAAVLVFKLKPYLVGLRCLLVIPIVPMADGLVNGAMGWPTWVALNSGYGFAATDPAAVLSFVLACIMVYVLILAIDPPQTDPLLLAGQRP